MEQGAAKFVLVAALIVIIAVIACQQEAFASKREKAAGILGWFETNPRGTYTDYKTDLRGQSDVVEYEDARALGGARSLRSIMNIIA